MSHWCNGKINALPCDSISLTVQTPAQGGIPQHDPI